MAEFDRLNTPEGQNSIHGMIEKCAKVAKKFYDEVKDEEDEEGDDSEVDDDDDDDENPPEQAQKSPDRTGQSIIDGNQGSPDSPVVLKRAAI